MALGKQAKILSKADQEDIMKHLCASRHAIRNKAIFLLSVRAGLRAKEIACLTWRMILNADGTLAQQISLSDDASKGKSGGTIWMNADLHQALDAVRQGVSRISESDRVFKSERGQCLTAQVVVNLFWRWYKRVRLQGCSSHSGRRTFITTIARKISIAGGSMRDVQMLARHSSLQMTQRYIEADVEAQRKVVQMI